MAKSFYKNVYLLSAPFWSINTRTSLITNKEKNTELNYKK